MDIDEGNGGKQSCRNVGTAIEILSQLSLVIPLGSRSASLPSCWTFFRATL